MLMTSHCKDSGQAGSETDPHAAKSDASFANKTLFVRVNIPPNHHAYLDAGKDGAFIPITIEWKDLIEKSIIAAAPAVKSAPLGVYDSDSGAKVLRGSGEFTFETDSQLAGNSIQIRTQICDDVKGICYRPTTQSVVIKKL